MRIEIQAENPDPSAHDRILSLLDKDNFEKTGRKDGSDFAVLIRDSSTADVVGGLWAVDDIGWAFITYLYVPPALRGQNLGLRLMQEAEIVARDRGMIGLWVNTFDFQAKGFYEKLGYSEFGALEGGPSAAGQSFLKKRF